MDKIYWVGLSLNPNAIEILKEHPDRIDWNMLSHNKNAVDRTG
jgi:hypothetical protein